MMADTGFYCYPTKKKLLYLLQLTRRNSFKAGRCGPHFAYYDLGFSFSP